MIIAGVDEAGRGPLAGPVIAAAVILKLPIEGLDDSKKLGVQARIRLRTMIENQALCFAIGRCEPWEIDRVNIHHATLLAMKRAIEALSLRPELVLVDGKFTPDTDIPSKSIIHGDSLEASISAASILAKVHRDEEMIRMDTVYPEYGFAKHKGYPTAYHKQALSQYGACEIHRRSFQPVAEAL